jgi:hypothetical protein
VRWVALRSFGVPCRDLPRLEERARLRRVGHGGVEISTTFNAEKRREDLPRRTKFLARRGYLDLPEPLAQSPVAWAIAEDCGRTPLDSGRETLEAFRVHHRRGTLAGEEVDQRLRSLRVLAGGAHSSSVDDVFLELAR